MKTLWLVLCLGTLAFAGSRVPLTSDLIVKVESSHCKTSFGAKKGSGLLFREGSNAYVVTSEHVLYHSDSEFCHSVSNLRIGNQKARLLRADWGMGLGLLRLEGEVAFDLPELSDLKGSLYQKGDRVVTLGFPHQSSDVLQSPDGFLLSEKSTRALIPFVPLMLEVTRIHVEFGMSGGAAVTSDFKGFVGIVSHQRLTQGTAQSSGVTETNSVSPVSDNAFVIPADTAYRWLFGILNHQEPGVSSIVRAVELNPSQEEVFSSGLSFSTTGVDGEGGPVGGAEGIGAININGSPKEIVLGLDKNNHLAAAKIPGRENWMNEVRGRLLKQEKVTITGFVEENPTTLEYKKHDIHSLPEFFKLLNDARLSPITEVEATLPGAVSNSEILRKEIFALGEAMLPSVENLLKTKEAQSSIPLQAFLRQLQVASEILKSENCVLLSTPKIDKLLNDDAWRTLFNLEFNTARQLMSSLIEAKASLNKLRV